MMLRLLDVAHLAGEVAGDELVGVAVGKDRCRREPGGNLRDRRLDVIVEVLRPAPHLLGAQLAHHEAAQELAARSLVLFERDALVEKLGGGECAVGDQSHTASS